MQTYTWKFDERFSVTTDLTGVDLEEMAKLIDEHDWTVNTRPHEMTIEAIQNSLTFVVLERGKKPVGFVRLVTDYVTMAYVTDVNISRQYQGLGLSKFMFQCVFEHPAMAKIRRVNLITPNAHGLYAKFGFKPISEPQEFMERLTSYEEAYEDYRLRHQK